MKKITIITDAWEPQVNGVVQTIKNTIMELEQRGYKIQVISPDDCFRISLPTYKEIKVSLNPQKTLEKFKKFDPDYVHIATEGPLGVFYKIYLDKHNLNYSTSYHTNFDDYISVRFGNSFGHYTSKYLKWFHSKSKAILVPTQSTRNKLWNKNYKNLVIWSRGVDDKIFSYLPKEIEKNPKPVLLYVGRVSAEKNLIDFFNIEMNATKIVVGDGPLLQDYIKKYGSRCTFLGKVHHHLLGTIYRNADVFVFPSRSDTFGMVIIEANACGLPVAAYNVEGPRDIIKNGVNGYVGNDLKESIIKSLSINPLACSEYTFKNYSWKSCTDIFEKHLISIDKRTPRT